MTDISPKNISTGSKQQEYRQVYRRQTAENIALTETQIKKLSAKLKKELTGWEEDSASLMKRLEERRAASEGFAVEQEREPYVGAFMTHIDLCGPFLRIYTRVQLRSLFGADSIWYATVEPEYDNLMDVLADVDEMFNYKARNEWNLIEVSKEAVYCSNRDGLSAIGVTFEWEEEYKEDSVLISDESDFMAEFPDAESIGMSEQKYNAFKEKTLKEAFSNNYPVEIPISYDKTTYFGPKANLIERADFVTFPAMVEDLDFKSCRGYGWRFYYHKSVIKNLGNKGVWDKELVDDYCDSINKKSGELTDYKKQTREFSGIDSNNRRGYQELFFIVFSCNLEDFKSDQEESVEEYDEERKYIAVFSKEKEKLLMVKPYYYRSDRLVALFMGDKRPGLIDGRTILDNLIPLNIEVDHIHNQRIQSRDITNIPSFKARKPAKKSLDLAAEENLWYPGVIFYLDDPQDFDQFRVQPVDLGQSLTEEQNLLRYASLIVSLDPFLFSGRASSDDPNAPGNKTGLLVQQSNMMMEDPTNQLRRGVEEVGNIAMSHLYQFGPPEIEFYGSDQTGKQTKKILKKRILRSGIKLKMRPITVTLNPDALLISGMREHQLLLSEPNFASDEMRRVKHLRSVLRDARIPNYLDYIPSDEEIMQKIQAQQAAVQQQQRIAAATFGANMANQEIEAKKIESDINIKEREAAIKEKSAAIEMVKKKQEAAKLAAETSLPR